MDIEQLWLAMGDWRLWILCAVAGAFGAAGGFIRAISRPDPARKGAWKESVVGAVAAVALLYASEPEGALALIGGSLVAGYVGQTALDALAARFQLREARDEAAAAADDRDKAIAAAHLALGDASARDALPDRVRARLLVATTGNEADEARALLRSIRPHHAGGAS